MEEIKIVSRYDSSKVLLCGKYESVKDCLEKNRGANLEGANLGGANLEGANLEGANLWCANLWCAYLGGANLRGAYLRGANLEGAYLWGANLEGANLRGAYLRGANLRGANLEGAKSYYSSHDFCFELIRRQDVKFLTDKEWVLIGVLSVHRFCWETIKKKHGKVALSVAKKLKKIGYGEYYDKLMGK